MLEQISDITYLIRLMYILRLLTYLQTYSTHPAHPSSDRHRVTTHVARYTPTRTDITLATHVSSPRAPVRGHIISFDRVNSLPTYERAHINAQRFPATGFLRFLCSSPARRWSPGRQVRGCADTPPRLRPQLSYGIHPGRSSRWRPRSCRPGR